MQLFAHKLNINFTGNMAILQEEYMQEYSGYHSARCK